MWKHGLDQLRLMHSRASSSPKITHRHGPHASSARAELRDRPQHLTQTVGHNRRWIGTRCTRRHSSATCREDDQRNEHQPNEHLPPHCPVWPWRQCSASHGGDPQQSTAWPLLAVRACSLRTLLDVSPRRRRRAIPSCCAASWARACARKSVSLSTVLPDSARSRRSRPHGRRSPETRSHARGPQRDRPPWNARHPPCSGQIELTTLSNAAARVIARVGMQSHNLVSENPELVPALLIRGPAAENDNCEFSIMPITFTPKDLAC
ncbi:hypothetical protein EV192_107109 [Actinocrispum wychmicini]|uniref:Uncharacterized protein n=1 Tax=Actinocrispum wychmicini TaxID=1213861 RepID=A0A4R2JBD9_9PSEU|nr:hypothetical protein EV192_107109 [Actinocrispum wychmicini]